MHGNHLDVCSYYMLQWFVIMPYPCMFHAYLKYFMHVSCIYEVLHACFIPVSTFPCIFHACLEYAMHVSCMAIHFMTFSCIFCAHILHIWLNMHRMCCNMHVTGVPFRVGSYLGYILSRPSHIYCAMSVYLFSIIVPLSPPPSHSTQSPITQVLTQAEELTGEVKKLQSEMVSSIKWKYVQISQRCS